MTKATLRLRRLVETDRSDLVRFLERDPVANVHLLSRIAHDGVVNEVSGEHGALYGHYGPDGLDGVAFFGLRREVLLSGSNPAFLEEAAGLALGEEAGWVILLGPRVAVDAFLSHYRWRGAPMRVHRVQDLLVLGKPGPPVPRVSLRRAVLADLDSMTDLSERMLLEDFDLPAGSLSRDGIQESARSRIENGRTWLAEEGGRIVFKADVSARYAGGAQIEGIYTIPEARGRGIGSGGVSELSGRLLRGSAFVALHVGRDNHAARRAYEKAGFHLVGELGLVLLGKTEA
jgi:hypothetical protein